MYYIVEAISKQGLLAGQRTTIGLEVAKVLRDHLQASGAYSEVNIYSTNCECGLIDKKEKLYV